MKNRSAVSVSMHCRHTSEQRSNSLHICLLLAYLLLCCVGCSEREGQVLNVRDNSPIQGAVIYHNGEIITADAAGRFQLRKPAPGKPLLVKAPGFEKGEIILKRYLTPHVRLAPKEIKALYLSHAGVGAAYLREPIFSLIERTDLNAVVVDVKGPRGLISFSSEIPIGHKIGAFSSITMDDPDSFIAEMRKRNIYVIGRICVFKDHALANNKREWAAINPASKKPHQDGDKMSWVDPYNENVWDYNLALAKAAAELGFDEIQFDWLRFPSGDAEFSKENTEQLREGAILGFLQRARKELARFNVYISVAVSGDALWRDGDANIGQNLSAIAPLVDFVSPCIYPSDIPASAFNLSTNAVAIPGEAVTMALKSALERTGGRPEKVRPWLQGFKDYSRLRLPFRNEEIAQEILACQQANVGGWMLYNPENKYLDVPAALEQVKLALGEANGVTAQLQR